MGLFSKSIRIASLLCGLSSILPGEASALDIPAMWHGRFSTLKGDLKCQYGDPDCNRCANDVRAEFTAFKSQTGADFDYSYEINDSYGPADIKPLDFLSRAPFNSAHLQTFTRLPLESSSGDKAWFAATYGGGSEGYSATYLVRAPTQSSGAVNGKGYIAYIYAPKGQHPGGSQGLGHYLLVGHDEEGSSARVGYIEVYDLADPAHGTITRKDGPTIRRSSGVGAAKLAGGGLAVLSKQGGPNNSYQLYYANTVERGMPGWQFLANLEGNRSAENVSLITECGTGDIYAMAATGDDNIGTYDTNYFTLHKLTMSPQGPTFALVDSTTNAQVTNCDARAAGTAYVAANGNLAFYCAQKLGTKAREEALGCVLPFFPNRCEGWKECLKEFAKDLFVPGIDCVNTVKLDSEMTLRQYW